jgi:hypothetical protein
MIGHIRIYISIRVGGMMEQPGVEDVRIQSLDIQPLTADDRKTLWLYRVTAGVADKLKPTNPDNASSHGSAIWMVPLQMRPDENAPEECWIEIKDSRTGQHYAEEVLRYHIPDFSNWKDHDAFEAAFARLLRDLKASESTGEGAGAPPGRP